MGIALAVIATVVVSGIGAVVKVVDTAFDIANGHLYIPGNTTNFTTLFPPSRDAFYVRPPDDFASHPPGTILRYRPPPGGIGLFGNASSSPMNNVTAYQIQFRTTNSQGEPDTAITTILIPHGPNTNLSRLISYQDMPDAAYINCAPSYTLQLSESYLSSFGTIVESGLLNAGYAISIPDYAGTQAAFSSGLQTGRATLDSIRAVLSSSNITGLPSSGVEVGMWGYSGGSIATEWAAELQPSYAPELGDKIVGAAIGGAVVNLNNTIKTMNNGDYAGLGIAGLWGFVQAFETEDMKALLEEEVLNATRMEFEGPKGMCSMETQETFQFKDVFKYLKSGEGFLNKEPLRSVIEKVGIMGKQDTIPQIPLYFYRGKMDEVSSLEDNDKLVEDYCKKGVKSLVYKKFQGDHSSVSILGLGDAMRFLRERFEGKEAQKGCENGEGSDSSADWGALEGFGDEVVNGLKELVDGGNSTLPDQPGMALAFQA